jgi:hypothetical protein
MLPTFFRLRLALPALLAVALSTAGLRAEEAKVRDYSPSDSLSEVLSTKHKAAVEAKDYATALSIVDSELNKLSDKTSYDAAILYFTKSQDLLQKGDYSSSIEPLEACLTLSESKDPTYFDDRVTLEQVYYLAILYYQEAGNSKNPTLTATYFDKAETYISRWLKSTKKVTVDALSFYASLLYNRAIQDAEHPDHTKLEASLKYVDQALHLAVKPKDNLYVLKLVCLQQLNRNAEATELLELLVQQKPENKTYWSQLAALYLGQNQDIRAILAFERAQAYGHMNAPKDNLNLIGIHFNLAQYGRAAELLEKGLHTGTLENELKNWELLASCYQQLSRDYKAIDVLVEATKQFPKEGQLEYLIAQNYYNMDKYPDALKHLQLCVQKGGGHKPHQAYLFLAFIAFDQKKFDIALDAANHAIAIPEGVKEGQRMKQAIEDALKEREAKLNKS